MSKLPNLTALLGLVAIAGYQNRDKISSFVQGLTGGGADVSIEALATQQTFESAMRSLRPGGTLSSLGVGLDWDPHPDVSLRVDWAGALRDTGLNGDLQDQGVTFRVTWRAL